MRRFLACFSVALVAAAATSASARVNPSEKVMKFMDDPSIVVTNADLPARVPGGYARADTQNFGYYTVISGQLYAIQGATEKWTWDHGASDPLEGWYAVDVSQNTAAYFKRIDAAGWSGHLNATAAPIPTGTGAAWVGIYEDEAQTLCWASGLGYGNQWCQRLTGPGLVYTGSGDVSIGFKYFNDSELNFDYTKVILRLQDGTETSLNGAGYTGTIGIVTGSAPTYETSAITVFNSQFAGQTNFSVVFEFTSDGGWSDEDGAYVTDYGPFVVDDIVLGGSVSGGPISYDFESGLQSWSATACAGFGSFFSVHPLTDYTVLDPCDCRLSGNVVAVHNAAAAHPYGQRVQAFSPPADKTGLGASYNEILADWDQYSIQPRANGVFYRPGWNFYPFICPETGTSQWSGRKGQDVWLSTGDDPNCFRPRNVGTDWGIPGSCELAGFVFEIYASCDAFGIPTTQCSGVTNFTPIVDNVQIRITNSPNAPAIAFDPGTDFNDGFGQGLLLSTTNVGNADITYDIHRDQPIADLLGDSLMIKGPVPTVDTKWESKLWFRIRREGPGQPGISGYGTWRTAVADGLTITGPTGSFTFGRMDSVQVGAQVSRNSFISEFREDDDDFATENTNNNEMIRDALLAPGTQIEYFVTANYIGNAENFLLPDTVGKNYLEFEILPSWRNVAGQGNRFPCVLYVDLNTGTQFYVENSLNVVMNGAAPGAPIPNPAPWDRYDYDDPTSNWNAPMARSIGGNNGVPLPQLLGYRQIILCTGGTTDGAMDTADFTLFSDWLAAIVCDGNVNRQGFIGNGDNLSKLLLSTNPSFLANYLGATNKCDAYNLVNCGPNPADESFCVRINNAAGLYGPALAYDAYGNWCPQKFIFDVLTATGGGTGNRVYNDYDAVPAANTNYAQVVKSVTGASSDNYRTVLDGVSYHRLSKRDVTLECVADSAHTVEATYAEIDAALDWIFGAGVIQAAPYCINPCIVLDVDSDGPVVDGGLVNRLYQNSPNPFNPRTSIKFSLAAAGPAELVIYDVNGRKVKTLVKGAQTAGAHDVVWDGTNDLGHKVGSGVFWSQLTVDQFTSNKKMVILK